ncbi:hypothetical protein [Actinoplanes sp. NPDC051494]|uniref:hypothetical protein n=1 Tax=Actinoplanes sp. NPDC051494 TaxID=3363907 RepID=UPI0037A24D24
MAAAVASALYLVQRQRPRHRPFGHGGWRFTALAIGAIATVTTGVSLLVAALSGSAVPPQVLAFAGPLGVGGVKAMTQRGSQGEPGPFQQWLTLGLPLMHEWLNDHLADVKHDQVVRWQARLTEAFAVERLIGELRERLEDRRLPGTARLQKRLELHERAYEGAVRRWAEARGRERRRAEIGRDIAVRDLLGLVYEARADRLIPVGTAMNDEPTTDGRGFVMTGRR